MYLLFDIGGTKTRVAIASNEGILDEKTVQIFPTPELFEDGIRKISTVGKELSSNKKISTACGGIGGPLNKEKTLLSNHAEKKVFINWEGKPLKAELEKEFDCDVFLENDAALGALGEATFGSGKEFEIVAYLTMGTGIGGARIVNNKIDENSLGFEPGQQIIDADGSIFPDMKPPIRLGQILGGQAIEKRTGKIASEIESTDFWSKLTDYLAIGLNDTIVHWSPDVIILDGSVAKDINLEKLGNKLTEILTILPSIPEVRRATLGEFSGLYGALQYLKTKD